MTSNDPDAIRREIEQTRAHLSQDVNALADEAKPGNVVKRQVEGVKESAQGIKERIFGSADDDRYAPYDQPYGHEPSVGDRVQQFGTDARDTVQDAPRQLKQRTRGNPLAAGLIAFGIGALIGGLMPTTRKEQELAADLKDRAQPLMDQAQDAAKQAAENLKPQAQQAVQTVKESATDSAQVVADEGKVHAEDVRDHAQSSAEDVRGHAQQAGQEVRDMSEQQQDPGVGQPGSSADYSQADPQQAEQSTGYPQADQEFTQSIDQPGEGGGDPRPENQGL
ncbi:DUF3618 domain-containing protein [Enemella sp. A6]|uniref:DUF3618 domain-containing protein n=1 Tax=Enemella sp. A6 TaxID=3440152 RepID=UPI003EBA8F97